MAEGTYEYECERAELLGLEKPDRESFESNRAARIEHEQEEVEIAQDSELHAQGEQFHGTSGKLDELNSILSSTQKKLNNKFKTVCGSLTSLIKIRPGGSTSDVNQENNADEDATKNDINTAIDTLDAMKQQEVDTDVNVLKKSVRDVGHKVTSQLDVLDSLINKADRAEASMSHQNQQMKKILKK